MAPQISMIVTDIDGTILNSEHQVSPKLKGIIPQLKEKKIPLVLISARSPEAMAPIADELQLETPIAAYNGAFIVAGTEEIFSQPIDFTEANKVIQLARHNFPNIAINLYVKEKWLVEKKNKWVELEEAITQLTASEINLMDFLLTEPVIHKVLFIGEEEEIAQLNEAIGKLVLMESSKYLSKANYLEFTHKSVSKGQALTELARYYHLDKEEVMAIGDHDNDVSMITAAGLGVAMGNATEACKVKAQVITTDNDQQGAAEAIIHQVLTN